MINTVTNLLEQPLGSLLGALIYLQWICVWKSLTFCALNVCPTEAMRQLAIG